MKIGITADSSSGLEYVNFKHKVLITRTTINFKDRILLDGVDITADAFYHLLSKTQEIPSTSAPTPGVILEQIIKLKAQGCTDVIHFPISTGLSDYGKNIKATMDPLCQEIGINFHVYDSKTACLMQGLFALYASYLADHGSTIQEIFQTLENYKKNQYPYFVVDDLKYLIKNGRLSGITGNIAILLKIKPVLIIDKEGRIVTFEKVRTHNKAIERTLELTKMKTTETKNVLYLSVHTNRYEDAVKLKETLDGRKNCYKTIITTITPTVGAHIGSGILGAVCIGLTDEEVIIFDKIFKGVNA
ncbi:MAG: DegV family protein [Acholeplasmatales bacterium]|jgi:DegV family protein with EDD domain|nr:DegV family protein [Acholeplasmatales bacterium]